jgi:hypothetical protein
MIPQLSRRLAGAACATAAVAGVVIGVAATGSSGAGASPGVAPASSAQGGLISKAEVSARMKNWYDRAPSYSQSQFVWDLGKTHRYRTDCSGFADMALHTVHDWNTASLATASSFHKTHDVNHDNRGWFTPAHVQTGDVFDDTTDGHAWVFASWAKDGKHFNYYNFGGGSSGTAPPEYHTNAVFSASELGYEPSNNYFVLRYNNIR